MKVLFILIILSLSSLAKASEVCSEYAQFQAASVYKKDVGPIRGQKDFGTKAELIGEDDNIFNYIVTIYDNNKYQPQWSIDYIVEVFFNGSSCELLSARKGLIKPPKEAGVFRGSVDRSFCGQFNEMILGDICIVYLTKADKSKIAIVFNRPTQTEFLYCSNVVINSHAISPIKNQAVINELRAYDPDYYYMYGTFYKEIFKEVR